MPHPLIRVLVLLVLASALPALALRDLLLMSFLMLVLLAACGRVALIRAGRGILRLRWLLLGILVLYAAFTVGEPVSAVLSGITREGSLEGLRRVLALVNLVAGVAVLLSVTSQPALAASIAMLLRPLRLLGWNPDRFARRLSLTLAAVGDLRLPATANSRAALLDAAAAAVLEVERRAAATTVAAPALPVLGRPPYWQWGLVLGLAALLHGVAS